MTKQLTDQDSEGDLVRGISVLADQCAFYRYQAGFYCAYATHGRSPTDEEVDAAFKIIESNRVAENKERFGHYAE